MKCYYCYVGKFHFFCNYTGKPNLNPLTRASEDCQKCLDGVEHDTHDQRAFKQFR